MFISTLRRVLRRTVITSFVSTVFTLALLTATGFAQSSTDGTTPPPLTPGAPAGSYPLSNFENINLFNGNLNFHLPLLSVRGRGEAQKAVMLKIEQRWRIEEITPCFPNCDSFFYPTYNWWTGLTVGYGPGVMQSRLEISGDPSCDTNPGGVYLSLLRLTFTAPDGTEYELRDKLTGGQPLFANTCFPTPVRGREWVTADGTSASYISDVDIRDDGSGFSSGFLLLRDGTRYRIESGGIVVWMQDRNGNRINFGYDAFNRVTTITDSLGRQVNIAYDVQDIAPFGLCDRITYKGFEGDIRSIRVSKRNLSAVLRAGFGIRTTLQLFPELSGSSSTSEINPQVTSAVWLPDGRSYRFFYNDYVELARVELPTGGAFEYDWAAGVRDTNASGVFWPNIYRRVVERRVYSNGGSGTAFDLKTTYSRPEQSPGGPIGNLGYVVMEQADVAGSLVSSSTHHFFGYASFVPFNPFNPGGQITIHYTPWKFGREHKTELTGDGGVVARRIEQTIQQKAPVSWWDGSADDEPPNDPRVVEAKTTLVDSNQVAKQVFAYDEFNNRTDVWEHGFGTGTAGSVVRHTTSEYLSDPGYTNAAGNSPHLRGLPVNVFVKTGSEVTVSHTTYEYDNYTADAQNNHAALVSRANVIGHDSAHGTNKTKRGNVTAVTHNLTSSGAISSYRKYDVLGNIIATKDGRGFQTVAEFNDRFGSPDGEARQNTQSPTELGALNTFGFPTKVTNPLGHEIYTQFDYYLGQAVDSEDANGIVSSAFYDDVLDRPSRVIRANSVTGGPRSETRFTYSDSVRTITTGSDKATFGDNAMVSELVYDGLGRTIEARTFAPEGMIRATTTYDGLGRVKRTTNPHIITTEDTYGYTETSYDLLSRVRRVETFDKNNVSSGAVVTTYSGNKTTVTDQAGKKRRSLVDALGRLLRVDEPNAAGSLDDGGGNPLQPTSYSYDVLDNLTGVTQGGQSRSFDYDGIGRLESATNPESGTVSYVYDPNGNLTQKTDSRQPAVTTTYVYDSLNRATGRTYSDGTPSVTYTYEAAGVPFSKGRMTRVSSLVSVYDYKKYDAVGRIEECEQTTSGQVYNMKYEYDLAGNMTSQTYPSGRKVDTSYDTAGRMSLIKAVKERVSGQVVDVNKTYASSFSYGPHGAVTGMTLGNGRVEHTSFNSRLQPTLIGLGTSVTDSSILKLEYGFGTMTNNGNVMGQKTTVPGLGQALVQTYGYDSLNRLEEARENLGSDTGALQWKQRFTYDRFGNRNFHSDTTLNVMGPNPVMNQTNNRIAANQGYSYDGGGNLTQMPTGGTPHTMGYDGDNRQKSFTNGGSGATTTYEYDGDGRRVKKVDAAGTTVFVYNVLGQLIAEYKADPVPPPPAGGGTSYLTTDHLGSTRVATAQNGSVKARYDYLPFGEALGAGIGGRTVGVGYDAQIGLRQKFTQKERDAESGLDYFLARYYSSPLGRFASVDPENAGSDANDAQSWHSYQYARNNPLIYVDPSGRYYDLYDAKGNFRGRVHQVEELTKLGYRFVDSEKEGTVLHFDDAKGNKYTAQFYEDRGVAPVEASLDFADKFVLEMERRAPAMNQAIGLAAGVNLAPVVVIGGHAMLTGGGGLTALGISGGPVSVTAGSQGVIIGWGTGQSALAVLKTQQITQSLTAVKVAEMIGQGLSKAWVQDQLAKYNASIAQAGAKLQNTQLVVRKELMEKILSLWPD